MNTSEKLFSARILTLCVGLSIAMLSVVIYDAYATEIKQELVDAVINALPDLDSSLAKL